MRNTTERRQSLIELMCERRHEHISNIAFEFNVTRRTIETDIQVLSLAYPIYTSKGTGGGVHIVEGYYIGRKYLKSSQKELLERLKASLTEEDAKTLTEILKSFALPNKK